MICEERKTDLKLLAILLIVTLALRGWLLVTTEVAARDSIGYIRYALELESSHLSWGKVLRKNDQHPGYPLAILAIAQPVRAIVGLTPYSMQLSAQLASALAAVLLVVPMFYLGKTLLNQTVGFWGALLFQFLPLSGHLMSDGCSEALYFLFVASAMLTGVKAVQGNSPWPFGLCGLFCGLAYLTRPEGAVVLPATGMVLLAMQWFPNWRRSWPRVLAFCGCLTLTALLVGSLYFGFTHRFTNKPSANEILHPHMSQASEDLQMTELSSWPLFASIWAAHSDPGITRVGAGRSLVMLATEIVHGFYYVGGLAVLLGLWWNRLLFRNQPGVWILVLVCSLYALVLFRLGMSAGYISDRHVMILILCGCYPLAAALCGISQKARQNGKCKMQNAKSNPFCIFHFAFFMVLACLPKTLQPLHANRAGIHAAGLWLERHVHPGDEVVDDHCWAHYYAGLVFLEGKIFPIRADAMAYTVISRAKENHDDKGRGKIEANLRAVGGKVAYSWPPDKPLQAAKVVVYAQSKARDSR
jgi:4-amino-4-deoxy-L-arabinose transferase-like glycosyltransferase